MDRIHVVVDTDALIDYFAGISSSAEAIAHLLKEDRLAVTALSLFELACGTQTKKQFHDLELLTRAVHLIALDSLTALQAGAVYRKLRAAGELGVVDLLIAGCCLARGLPLFTRNTQHFSRVRGLKLLTAEDILKGSNPLEGVMDQEIITIPDGPVGTDPIQHQRRKQIKFLR